MTGLRLLFITRRFWPLVGGAERAMAHLAAGCQALGHPTTVLTPCWHPHWPMELEQLGFHVVRLPHPPQHFWNTWQWMRGVRRWLLRRRRQFDLALVSMLRHEAFATLGAAGHGKLPVVLRAEGTGVTGDRHWQRSTLLGGWTARRCRQAAAIVAPGPAIESELLDAGYSRAQVRQISNGAALPPAPSARRRVEARAALATGNSALGLAADTPLVLFAGRLEQSKGLADLIECWPIVLQAQPTARLWLAGEGPEHDRLQHRIDQLRLGGRAKLVGAFDSVDELLAAADLFVLPSLEEGMSLALLEAMAHALPIVASNIPGNRSLIAHEEHGLLAPGGAPKSLAAAIDRLLADRALGVRLGSAARERVARQFGLQPMIERHLHLFQQVVGGHAVGNVDLHDS
jgi:glycosyltransferase involved in cell wall biosynthesis